MIGSETFIIVAFRCSEKSSPCSLASAICSCQERIERPGAHHRAVDDLALQHLDAALEHGRRAVGRDVLDPQLVGLVGIVTDSSVERKSPSDIVATCERLSFDHAPIECGCLRA